MHAQHKPSFGLDVESSNIMRHVILVLMPCHAYKMIKCVCLFSLFAQNASETKCKTVILMLVTWNFFSRIFSLKNSRWWVRPSTNLCYIYMRDSLKAFIHCMQKIPRYSGAFIKMPFKPCQKIYPILRDFTCKCFINNCLKWNIF